MDTRASMDRRRFIATIVAIVLAFMVLVTGLLFVAVAAHDNNLKIRELQQVCVANKGSWDGQECRFSGSGF